MVARDSEKREESGLQKKHCGTHHVFVDARSDGSEERFKTSDFFLRLPQTRRNKRENTEWSRQICDILCVHTDRRWGWPVLLASPKTRPRASSQTPPPTFYFACLCSRPIARSFHPSLGGIAGLVARTRRVGCTGSFSLSFSCFLFPEPLFPVIFGLESERRGATGLRFLLCLPFVHRFFPPHTGIRVRGLLPLAEATVPRNIFF